MMSRSAIDRSVLAGDAPAAGGIFDAIVIGSGAAGGLAASLLCEGGLNVLLLEAAHRPPFWQRPLHRLTLAAIKSVADARLLTVLPPKAINAGRKALRAIGGIRQSVQSRCFAWERMPEIFVDDMDFPYETTDGRPFTWIRAHAVGGRMIVPGHGRQYYRMGRRDFAPDDGLSPPWPFPEHELDPWYALVERRLRLTGARDGLDCVPDSEIARPSDLTPQEAALVAAIRAKWPEATPIASRYAPPLASFESAARTGRLVCRTGAVVQEVKFSPSGRVAGTEWHDLETRRRENASAPIVFLCASTLESTRILMQSARDGEIREGALGHYLMDHMLIKAEGVGPKLQNSVSEPGRCLYLPRFDLRDGKSAESRGFGIQVYQTPTGSCSWFTAVAFSESAPRYENHVSLHPIRKDACSSPVLSIDFRYSAEEYRTAGRMMAALEELADISGVTLTDIELARPGTSVHECGTARMGCEPGSSVVDPHNECWFHPGLYITDGAVFPSVGTQNPTLTIMALTARACDRALSYNARQKLADVGDQTSSYLVE